jgi:hypothetical protein
MNKNINPKLLDSEENEPPLVKLTDGEIYFLEGPNTMPVELKRINTKSKCITQIWDLLGHKPVSKEAVIQTIELICSYNNWELPVNY